MWHNVRTKFHKNTSGHSLVITCVQTDMTGNVLNLGYFFLVCYNRQRAHNAFFPCAKA